MKTDLFQSYGHCWVFQICWHIECNTFTASSFRIWNSSTGILSPPLAVFVVMLSKVHLTSHSRMSGSKSVITPSWLSGSWRSFLYSSSVYSCHLFLISSASVNIWYLIQKLKTWLKLSAFCCNKTILTHWIPHWLLKRREVKDNLKNISRGRGIHKLILQISFYQMPVCTPWEMSSVLLYFWFLLKT